MVSFLMSKNPFFDIKKNHNTITYNERKNNKDLESGAIIYMKIK